jgi:hypothetical protein
MKERLQYNETARDQYDELLEDCPWFDIDKHFLATIEDDSGNIAEIVGVGSTFSNVKRALRHGWRRVEKHYPSSYSVSLYEKGWLRSYVV